VLTTAEFVAVRARIDIQTYGYLPKRESGHHVSGGKPRIKGTILKPFSVQSKVFPV
jgi:hypothetical protein